MVGGVRRNGPAVRPAESAGRHCRRAEPPEPNRPSRTAAEGTAYSFIPSNRVVPLRPACCTVAPHPSIKHPRYTCPPHPPHCTWCTTAASCTPPHSGQSNSKERKRLQNAGTVGGQDGGRAVDLLHFCYIPANIRRTSNYSPSRSHWNPFWTSPLHRASGWQRQCCCHRPCPTCPPKVLTGHLWKD